jgi:hypothetical protein
MSHNPRPLRDDAALAAVILLLGSSLLAIGQPWTRLGPGQVEALTFDQLLGLGANLLGLAVVSWWGLSFVLGVVANVLNRAGWRVAAKVASKATPAFMLRIGAAVLSVNLLGVTTAFAGTVPEPQWKSTSATQTPRAAWTSTGLNVSPGWKPRDPIIDPGLLSSSGKRLATSAASGEEIVVVRPGDTLWSIAAGRSGPFATDLDVALEWPKWYAANKAAIGDDPAVLHPGQVLQPPPRT